LSCSTNSGRPTVETRRSISRATQPARDGVPVGVELALGPGQVDGLGALRTEAITRAEPSVGLPGTLACSTVRVWIAAPTADRCAHGRS
jgi:hypothetical protein